MTETTRLMRPSQLNCPSWKGWRFAFGAEKEPWAYSERMSGDLGIIYQERLSLRSGAPDEAYG